MGKDLTILKDTAFPRRLNSNFSEIVDATLTITRNNCAFCKKKQLSERLAIIRAIAVHF